MSRERSPRRSRSSRRCASASRREGYPMLDFGTAGEASVDYPDFAAPAARAVAERRGAARHRDLRLRPRRDATPRTASPACARRWCRTTRWRAWRARHNDANMLALPGDRLDAERAWPIVEDLARDALRGRPPRARASRRSTGSRARRRRAPLAGALDEVDPEIAPPAARRGAAPGALARADRVRELRLRGGARGRGLGAHQQVRRGLPGPPLLRRLRGGRRGRGARDRARQGALRRRPRQRAAALGLAGERGGLPRASSRSATRCSP